MENNKIPLFFSIGGDTRIRTGDQSFADSCLSHLAMSPYKITTMLSYTEAVIRFAQTASATWLCCHIKLKFGAGNGAQTRDLCLGKAALYQLSYSRIF